MCNSETASPSEWACASWPISCRMHHTCELRASLSPKIFYSEFFFFTGNSEGGPPRYPLAEPVALYYFVYTSLMHTTGQCAMLPVLQCLFLTLCLQLQVRICAFPASRLGLQGIGISPDCNPENRASPRQVSHFRNAQFLPLTLIHFDTVSILKSITAV